MAPPTPSQKEKLLLGLLLNRGELVIRETELPVKHQPNPGLRSQNHCPVNGLGLIELH